MPAKSQAQKAMMCKEAKSPGSTKAKGISQKAASEYCHTKGSLPKKSSKKSS